MTDLHNFINMMLKTDNKITLSSSDNKSYLNVNFTQGFEMRFTFDRNTGDFINVGIPHKLTK